MWNSSWLRTSSFSVLSNTFYVLETMTPKEIRRIIGYQLKEGKRDATQPTEREFYRSFVVKGASPNLASARQGWYILSDSDIEKFFGVSGKYWTPKECSRLAATAAIEK